MSNHKEENLFYTRCYVQSKVCSLKIDERSSNNVASEYMVQKLGLTVKQHPWLDDNYKLRVSRQVKVSIAFGKYEDEILCDVQPMETCHILLRTPWLNERRVIHDGHKNRYSLKHKGSKIILIPMSSHEIQQDQLILKQRIKQECHDTFHEDTPKKPPTIFGEENQLQTCQEDIGEDSEQEPKPSKNSSLDSSGEPKQCHTMEQENDKAEAVMDCRHLPRAENIMVIKEKQPDAPPPNKTRDCSDLRSNPFQEGGDDMILDSTKDLEHGFREELVAEDVVELAPADEHEDEEIFLVPIDLMIRARASNHFVAKEGNGAEESFLF